MSKISIALLLLCVAGCRPTDFSAEFNKRPFDKKVIEKLPLYDSIVNVLVENYAPVHEKNKGEMFYKYIHVWDSKQTYGLLPPPGTAKLYNYFNQIGKDLIYGFEFYKDSTVKILIREDYLELYQVEIQERLSYYPAGSTIKKREFPIKDTMLTSNWQYWIWFAEEGGLF